ncbi:MAG: hypothetical protein LBN97_03200 [Oscillospiraceae bacterium]|jgi:uncharacterized protein YukE|nr:hypothetical protein [Oscillospiraceae bacterium]
MITFDHGKAMRQVSELRQIASDLNQLLSGRFANAVNTADSSWDGEASEIFRRKCNELSSNIAKEAKRISDVADSLQKTADEIRRAEEEAERIAREFSLRKSKA